MAEKIAQTIIPMTPIGSIDDLLDAARKGAVAASAIDAIKDKLSAIRDKLYIKLLNAPDAQVLDIRSELKGIEKLARALLVDEARGDVAYKRLLGVVGEPAVRKPETASRTRRQRATGATAKS